MVLNELVLSVFRYVQGNLLYVESGKGGGILFDFDYFNILSLFLASEHSHLGYLR